MLANTTLSILQWLGVDTSKLPSGNAVEFEWAQLPQSLGAFALVAVVLLLIWYVVRTYRREIDTCPPRVKMLLAGLRICVILLLVLIFLSPQLVPLLEKTVQRTILLMRDKSKSMDNAENWPNADQAKVTASALDLTPEQLRAAKLSRAKIMDNVLAKDQYKFLRDLQERGKLLVMDFDEIITKPIDPRPSVVDPATAAAVTPVSTAAAQENALPPLKLDALVADGRATDLWLAIHEPLSSRTPSAMILFTDGQHTGREDPREAAREALRQQVKLYIVGIGDPSRPKNIRIDTVYVQPNLWRKDDFGVEVSLSVQDIEPQSVQLELIEQKANDNNDQLSAEKVVVTEDLLLDKSRITKTIKHSQNEPGKYVYSVRIRPLEDESNVTDNQAASSPTLVRDKENLKVLLVSGAPTWEYRLVQKLLTRDESIQVTCWLQTLDEDRAQDGDRPPISRLPLSLQELNEYGVILLFDPNPMEFDQAWIDTLKKYVSEHSGGVMFMAGPKFTGSFLTNARTRAMADLLPVRFGDVGAVDVQILLSTNARAFPLRVVPANSDHDILRFYEDRQLSQQRWESLPGIFWSFPAQGPKPTAQVLLEHSDTTLRTGDGSRPLLVTGRYGAGNTAYVGFNGTWRWRQTGREAEFFDKFWVKTVRYLADARSSKGRRYGSLETNKDRFEVGDRIVITARLRDAAYAPLKADQVEATLRAEGGAPVSIALKPVMGQDGTFEGHTAARSTGMHTLSVNIPATEGAKPTVDDKNFAVELPRVEMNQQWLNKPLLVELAELTGGKYFELNQLDKLIEEVPVQNETIVERGRPTSLWDLNMWGLWSMREFLLVAMVGLLSVEWAIRKAFKLL